MKNTTCPNNSSLRPKINSTEEFICRYNDNSSTEDQDLMQQVVIIIQGVIASVGIFSNFTVVVAFLNNKKFRQKIPNKFIINQVRKKRIIVFLCCEFFKNLSHIKIQSLVFDRGILH